MYNEFNEEIYEINVHFQRMMALTTLAICQGTQSSYLSPTDHMTKCRNMGMGRAQLTSILPLRLGVLTNQAPEPARASSQRLAEPKIRLS